MAFDIFGVDGDRDKEIKYGKETISMGNLKTTLAANNIYNQEDMKWYTRFNRYGYIDPYNETANREYLFFTKPDLNIFDVDSTEGNTDYYSLKLNSGLADIPIFSDAAVRFKNSLVSLQSSVKDMANSNNPFMCLLSNRVTSRLDLPGISAESNESAANMYGSVIQYRSSSFKSDNAYDFNLSFTDTKYLEIYMLAKIYDEYCRQEKLGSIAPRKRYIVNRVIDNQFSIYKFVVGADGEHILYFAKATGVYISDVPRGDMSDPGQDGFKFSLSFHAQFVEDSNPSILSDFNILTNTTAKTEMSVYNKDINAVNNKWAGLPYVVKVNKDEDKRAAKAARENHGNYIYLLKWRE